MEAARYLGLKPFRANQGSDQLLVLSGRLAAGHRALRLMTLPALRGAQ
jgi:hypothetical protein